MTPSVHVGLLVSEADARLSVAPYGRYCHEIAANSAHVNLGEHRTTYSIEAGTVRERNERFNVSFGYDKQSSGRYRSEHMQRWSCSWALDLASLSRNGFLGREATHIQQNDGLLTPGGFLTIGMSHPE